MNATTLGFIIADAASALLALYIAAFFARGQALAPGRGLSLLSVGFATLAVGYVAAAIDDGVLLPALTTIEAARAASVTAATVFLFAYYASRRGAWSLATTRAIVAAGATLALLYTAAYALAEPTTGLASPLATLPWLRLLGGILFILTALLVTMEVRARRFLDFRVPLAFLCLAFAQYTVALLAFHGEPITSWWVILWRIAGLCLLTSVAMTSGGVRVARQAA